MTTVAVCSAKGSPGVTTLACALGAVWPADRRVMVAEFDPSGGDIAPRFGLSAKRGVTSLVLEARHSTGEEVDLEKHLQALPGGLEVLVGPSGAAACRTVDAALPQCLPHLCARSRDVVIDCGRIQPGAPGQIAALASSDEVLVVSRPTVEAVASTRWIAERLNRGGSVPGGAAGRVGAQTRMAEAWLVVAGEGPVPASHASDALGLRLLAEVREDRLGAAAFRGEAVKAWRLARCDLVLSVKLLLETLLARDGVTEPRDEVGEPLAAESSGPTEPDPDLSPPAARITASNGRGAGR